jgi:lactoylglutathione lyase
MDNERGRFTLVFLGAPGNPEAQVELTHNWDPEPYTMGRACGHLAYEVDDIYDGEIIKIPFPTIAEIKDHNV